MKGEKHPQAKVTDQEVEEIRERYIPYVVTTVDLAEEYGISQAHVDRIIKGEVR